MNKSQTPLYLTPDTESSTKGAGINVYSNIKLDCQTNTKLPFCEDCFARKTCKLAR